MSLADLVPEAPWMFLTVQWNETWIGCEHCGRPIKRACVIEETATGRRLVVGQGCLHHYGLDTRRKAK